MAVLHSLEGRSRWAALALGLAVVLGVLVAWSNVRFAEQNLALPNEDDGMHALSALSLARLRTQGDDLPTVAAHSLLYPNYYPPLGHLWMSLFFAHGDPGVPLAVLSLGLFVVLLAVGTCGWATLLGGPLYGLACSLCVLVAPAVLDNFRTVMFDGALAAMMTLLFWTVTASDGFRRQRPALLAGVCLGIGMLTKFEITTFALPWILPDLAGALRQAWRARWRAFLWPLLALAVVAVDAALVTVYMHCPDETLATTADAGVLGALLVATGALAVIYGSLFLLRPREVDEGVERLWNAAHAVVIGVVMALPWYAFNFVRMAHVYRVTYETGQTFSAHQWATYAPMALAAVWLTPLHLVATAWALRESPQLRATAARLLFGVVCTALPVLRVFPLERRFIPVELYLIPLLLLWMAVYGRAARVIFAVLLGGAAFTLCAPPSSGRAAWMPWPPASPRRDAVPLDDIFAHLPERGPVGFARRYEEGLRMPMAPALLFESAKRRRRIRWIWLYRDPHSGPHAEVSAGWGRYVLLQYASERERTLEISNAQALQLLPSDLTPLQRWSTGRETWELCRIHWRDGRAGDTP